MHDLRGRAEVCIPPSPAVRFVRSRARVDVARAHATIMHESFTARPTHRNSQPIRSGSPWNAGKGTERSWRAWSMSSLAVTRDSARMCGTGTAVAS